MKRDKIDVHYRNGYKTTVCANCTMFQPPNNCTSVKGSIAKDALCDLFERKAQKHGGD